MNNPINGNYAPRKSIYQILSVKYKKMITLYKLYKDYLTYI